MIFKYVIEDKILFFRIYLRIIKTHQNIIYDKFILQYIYIYIYIERERERERERDCRINL